MTLAEINPLGQLDDGSFVVLDCHLDMEDEARDRHQAVLDELGITPDETRQGRPPTEFEMRGAQVDAADHRGVAGRVVEFDGNLGCVIGAGGGSLTIFDAVQKYGGKPANYCEIGGNPSVSKAAKLTKLILSKPGVEKIAVIMNVVSNTRVDIVARGVIKGVVESGLDPAEKIAIFRIPGSWEADGFKILEKYGVEYCDRTVSMSEAARRAVEKVGGVDGRLRDRADDGARRRHVLRLRLEDRGDDAGIRRQDPRGERRRGARGFAASPADGRRRVSVAGAGARVVRVRRLPGDHRPAAERD